MPAMCNHAADGSEKGDTTIDDGIVQDRRFNRRERFIPKESRRAMGSSYCKKLNFIYIVRQNLYLRTTYRLHLNTRARCYCCEVVYALVREQKTTTLNMVGKQSQASALIGDQDGVGGLNARAAAAAAASDRRGSGNAAAAVMIRRCFNDSGERAQLVQSLPPLLLLLLPADIRVCLFWSHAYSYLLYTCTHELARETKYLWQSIYKGGSPPQAVAGLLSFLQHKRGTTSAMLAVATTTIKKNDIKKKDARRGKETTARRITETFFIRPPRSYHHLRILQAQTCRGDAHRATPCSFSRRLSPTKGELRRRHRLVLLCVQLIAQILRIGSSRNAAQNDYSARSPWTIKVLKKVIMCFHEKKIFFHFYSLVL
ncbi:unnamed protein product, partial [Trichogramma brassicae]